QRAAARRPVPRLPVLRRTRMGRRRQRAGRTRRPAAPGTAACAAAQGVAGFVDSSAGRLPVLLWLRAGVTDGGRVADDGERALPGVHVPIASAASTPDLSRRIFGRERWKATQLGGKLEPYIEPFCPCERWEGFRLSLGGYRHVRFCNRVA